MKAKAYSYIRMSTDIQLRGDSLRRQTEASKKYATENDLELVEDFKLEDIGVSAFQGKNVAQGSLGKFLALVEEGQVPKGSYLIVESLDRISRQNPHAATALFLQILQAGINIVTLTDSHVYRADGGNFSDIIVSVVIMSRAYEESRTKSLRVGAAWENKRRNIHKRKLTRVAPIWLKLSEDRSSFELIPERAAVLRAIFDEADLGKGSLQIARRLNQEGVPTFAPSKGWYESYVSKVLTNRAVLGEFQPHHYVGGKRVPRGEPVSDYFPAIVSREQFERIQAGRAIRRLKGSGRKGRNNINLFQGVARCGYCNGRMMIVNKGDGPKGGVYLRCDNARRGADCKASNWPLDHFETAFLWFIEELDVRTVIDGSEGEEARKALDGQIAIVSAELVKQKVMRERAFELLGDSSAAAAFVKSKIDEASLSIDGLEKRLAELRGSAVTDQVRKSRPLEEVKEVIRNIGHWTLASEEARVKVSDWIKRNVKELLAYSDGLEPADGTKARQFSVLFMTGEFRTVRLVGADPTTAEYSIHATDDRWVLLQNGKQSVHH